MTRKRNNYDFPSALQTAILLRAIGDKRVEALLEEYRNARKHGLGRIPNVSKEDLALARKYREGAEVVALMKEFKVSRPMVGYIVRKVGLAVMMGSAKM